MDQERRCYEELLSSSSSSPQDQHNGTDPIDDKNDTDIDIDNEIIIRNKCAIAHNDYRKDCLHARWELTVHRQAVGFIVGNHKYVKEKFPIGDALPVKEEKPDNSSSSSTTTTSPHETKNKFGDQLDWWERIGRWK